MEQCNLIILDDTGENELSDRLGTKHRIGKISGFHKEKESGDSTRKIETREE